MFPLRKALLLFSVSVAGAAPTSNLEQRISDLIARMTIEEKVGQMSQSTSMATLTDQIKQEIRQGRWGSFLNAGSPADRAEAQRIARQESRLGIPLLFGRDVIHGYRTIYPIPLGQAASWDPALVEQAARMAAREAATEGIRWTFAPMLDIARDPRWGRMAESPGEDPYLASAMAAAMVHGFQGTSLDDAASLAACAKHFAGYGAAEGGRDYNSVWIPELLLRQVYLPPFHAALEAGVATFMTAFNTLNGVPASGNSFLLRQILLNEWKYDGFVVSDYNAITEMIAHGYAADPSDAARKAVNAGVDMEMVSTSYFDHLPALVASGAVDRKTIDNAVRNILRLKFRLGLFDEKIPAPATSHVTSDSLAVAERLATQGTVLLKNQGDLLPLSNTIGSVAVIGPLADSPVDQMGTWVMDGRTSDVQTPLAALRQMLGQGRVQYAPGLRTSRDTSQQGFAAALEAARRADAVLLFLGEEEVLSGEARSRAFLNLPGAQDALIAAVAAAGKPMVAIIMAGRPLTFHEAAEKVEAVLYAWHPGTMGGPALASLLFGRTSPSGKLPVTFPRTVGQVPIYYAHLSTGRAPSASELGVPAGTPVDPSGYTSRYIDVDFTPEYPFGYGLSYTTFEYSNLRLSASRIPMGGTITVSANLSNRGRRDGAETVQLYIHDVAASVAQPVRVLKGFRRVELKAGATETVSFSLGTDDLAFYNEKMQRVTEPGQFEVWIAPDSAGGLKGAFTVQ
jgi:beta-glucosidase